MTKQQRSGLVLLILGVGGTIHYSGLLLILNLVAILIGMWWLIRDQEAE